MELIAIGRKEILIYEHTMNTTVSIETIYDMWRTSTMNLTQIWDVSSEIVRDGFKIVVIQGLVYVSIFCECIGMIWSVFRKYFVYVLEIKSFNEALSTRKRVGLQPANIFQKSRMWNIPSDVAYEAIKRKCYEK